MHQVKYLLTILFLIPIGGLFSQNNNFYEGEYRRNTAHSRIMFENLTLKNNTFRWQSSFYERVGHTAIIEGTFQVVNDTLFLKPQKVISYVYNDKGEKIKPDTSQSTLKIRYGSYPDEWTELDVDFMAIFNQGKSQLKPNYHISIEDSNVTLTAGSYIFKKE